MKQYFFISFLFASVVLKAQFSIDCGRDTFFCVGLYPDTTFYIGTQVKLMSGLAPYQYSWTCDPIKVTSTITFTASNYLNDTSIANPYIKDCGIVNKPWCFYLTVKDNNNNIASDSILVQCSSFTYTTHEYSFSLNKGDSVQFFNDIFVGGGITPIKYYWTPSIWLDDSTQIDTWCKPQESTDYYQYIIDSVGCKSQANRAYNVYIMPTSIINNIGKNKNILNFRQQGKRLFFNNPLHKLTQITFYSIDGKRIHKGETNGSFFDFSCLRNKGSIIICVLSQEGVIGTLKIY